MKWIVDIKGEIEGDYELICKYEEKPKGKWISLGFIDEMWGNAYECSNCGEMMIGAPKYCCYCGAEMKGLEI